MFVKSTSDKTIDGCTTSYYQCNRSGVFIRFIIDKLSMVSTILSINYIHDSVCTRSILMLFIEL